MNETNQIAHLYQQLERERTERHRAEAALRESQRMLSELMHNLPGMAYRCRIDSHWTMEFVSDGCIALTGYTPSDLLYNRQMTYGQLIHSDDRARVQQTVHEALQNRRPFDVTYRLTTASGQEKWVWEQGRKVERADDDRPTLEGFITDMSERVMIQQQLEQRVQERTHQLTTLLNIAQHITSTLDMHPLLGLILEQVGEVVSYTSAAIFALEDDHLRLLSHRGSIANPYAERLSLVHAGTSRDIIYRGEPLIIADVQSDTPQAQMFQATAGPAIGAMRSTIRSWMGVPFMHKEHVIGMLTLAHAVPDVYTPGQARMVLAFAQQAGVAMENARLYATTRRHAEETEALLTVQQALTRRLDPDVVLQTIADAACHLTGASFGTVFLRQGDALCVSVLSGTYGPDMYVGYCMPLHGSATGLAMLSQQVVHIEDSHNDPRVHQDAMQRAGLRSLLGVPLLSEGEPIGVISVGNQHAGSFGSDDARILTMLAPGAVIALENARLYCAEQERRHEADRRRQIAEGLRDVLTALNSNLGLDDMLAIIAAQAQRLLDANAVAVYRLHEDAMLRVQATIGLDATYATRIEIRFGAGAVGQAVQERQPVAIRDTETFFAEQIQQHGDAIAPDVQTMLAAMSRTYRALLGVPLLIKQECYGAIALYYHAPRQFGDEEVSLAMTFADQVALAIESARFSEQAQQAAAQDERQRLARDLHDAVTQTLFSASMIADVLPRLWDRKPEEARRRLEELRQLTRGALAEMRTLLLELRPTALHESDLGGILRQLGEATTGRTRLPVTVHVTGAACLPPDVRVVLYRIAQEALHNVVKHAQANRVAITLTQETTSATLHIADDGCGFDAEGVPGGHFGLRIMGERAAGVGAVLRVASQPGQGTAITVTWNHVAR